MDAHLPTVSSQGLSLACAKSQRASPLMAPLGRPLILSEQEPAFVILFNSSYLLIGFVFRYSYTGGEDFNRNFVGTQFSP